MTRFAHALLTLPAAALLGLAGCSDEVEVPEAIDEADSVIVLDDGAGDDIEYLNSDRDPEGDGLQGEPAGEPGEAEDYESINENMDGNDPVETADRDADPLD